ncbi:MAG TPA: PrgI family protein [Candidatus Paceibacterota bacterium]
MEEYQVPQFIEVEDKIFGPLTLKQFVYVAGGIGLCVIILLSLPFYIGVILALPVALLSGGLAFYKVNNKNLVDMIEAALTFYTKERLYTWKKEAKKEGVPALEAPAVPTREKLILTQGKLKDLAWSLDIKDEQAKQ